MIRQPAHRIERSACKTTTMGHYQWDQCLYYPSALSTIFLLLFSGFLRSITADIKSEGILQSSIKIEAWTPELRQTSHINAEILTNKYQVGVFF
ncbi:hypothetical protein BDV18DRAFT_57481 [Aspergillus unguis]